MITGEPDRQLYYLSQMNRYRVSPARVPVIEWASTRSFIPIRTPTTTDPSAGPRPPVEQHPPPSPSMPGTRWSNAMPPRRSCRTTSRSTATRTSSSS